MDGATKWLKGWKAKGWKTADKKPVKNEDLWRALDDGNGAAPDHLALGARPFRACGK